MQFDVNIRLYEYWHEQVKIRKKRWNNKEIQRNFIENKFVNRKLEKGGWSVPRAPVSCYGYIKLMYSFAHLRDMLKMSRCKISGIIINSRAWISKQTNFTATTCTQ